MATGLELTLAHVGYFYSCLPPPTMEKGLDSGNNFQQSATGIIILLENFICPLLPPDDFNRMNFLTLETIQIKFDYEIILTMKWGLMG